MDRRDTLTTLAASTIVAPLSGCLDFAGLRPDSDSDQSLDDSEESLADSRRDGEQQADESGDPETLDNEANQEPDAEEDNNNEPSHHDEPEQPDAGENVLKFGDLQILEYEEVVEELEYDEEQISYTGKVENAGDEAYGSVVVKVRVYDGDGNELGSHQDLTPELEGGETWRFEIAPHSQPNEIADHDIAVTSK
ncbi:FxLYD domain-containing protein [Natronococcus sp. A-GB7]|uniref:FxLYD domain-containing protein n=1 Tax=Natronococcus sp. A-GB7 TaxID=3037649 RepID=UPI00241F07F0|nr:FxLYD domain-containing protein [Natronococcus sp. A-GB7]MDG5821577.1 FxLYD domain-containing protein [Natronococcus sp. A-GB7]